MAHYQDSNAISEISIHNRVRKNPQRKDSSTSRRWRAEARVFCQEIDNTFELSEKARCDRRSGLFVVEIHGADDVLLRPRVERVGHRVSLARSRAMDSGPGTAAIKPDSRSASLRSASRSQASSTSGSASRLAISRSSRCERSAGANCRTSASRISRFVLTVASSYGMLQRLCLGRKSRQASVACRICKARRSLVEPAPPTEAREASQPRRCAMSRQDRYADLPCFRAQQ